MKKLLVALLVASGCHAEENLGFTVVGEPRWAISLGGRANDRGMIAAFDSIDDVVVCGDVIGPADFGSGPDTTAGPQAFITKRVASDGAERWTKRLVGLNSMSHVWIGAMALTPQDEIVLTGTYVGSVDFGGQVLTLDEPEPPDHSDMFLAKYASDGQLLWVHGLAERSNARGTALAVDASGVIYATAAFMRGAIDLDGELYREADGDFDSILLVYNSDGTRRWFHVSQGASGPYPQSIALAANGDVLVAGSFGAPTSFGGAVVDPETRLRGFLSRYRNDGLYLASNAVGPVAPYTSWGPDVRVDSAGRIVLQQVEVDESDFPSSLWTQGSTVRVLDDAGEELWFTRIANRGGFAPQERTLLTTPGGLIASAAWTEDPRAATGNMEVLTFEPDGSNTMSSFGSRLVLGSAPGTFVFDGAVSSSGAFVLTGQFGGMLDFGTGALTTRGQDDTDVFVVVVNSPPPLSN